MQTQRTTSTATFFKILMAMVAGLFILAGCGGSDEEDNGADQGDKKPAYERVVVLKQRFSQLENSLDEMERDLKIQKKRVESTREIAKSIKRSLLKGNLKGYSLDTVSTDPMILQAIAKKYEKERKQDVEKEQKENSDNSVFDILLIILFFIFLIVIFVVALKDRKQASPYDAVARPAYPDSDSGAGDSGSDDGEPNKSADSSFEYGELHPPDSRDSENRTPPPDNKPDDEGPRP